MSVSVLIGYKYEEDEYHGLLGSFLGSFERFSIHHMNLLNPL